MWEYEFISMRTMFMFTSTCIAGPSEAALELAVYLCPSLAARHLAVPLDTAREAAAYSANYHCSRWQKRDTISHHIEGVGGIPSPACFELVTECVSL